MKKLLFILCSLVVLTPAYAKLAFHMDGPDSIVLVADSIEDMFFFNNYVEHNTYNNPFLDDENITKKMLDNGTTEPETPTTLDSTVPNWPFISAAAFSRITKNSVADADLDDDFDAIKGDMIRDIQALNLKTGYNISARDFSLWDKIKFVCGRVTTASTANMQISAPGFSSEEIAQGLNNLAQSALNSAQCYIFDRKLKREVRYTPEGLYWEIITNKPFLIVTLDEEVYKVLEKVEKSIIEQYGRTDKDRLLGVLVKNMAKFFDLRAKFYSMNRSFSKSTDDIMKMTKYSKGDAWSTWKVLADHTFRMNLMLNEEHLLSVEYEKGTLLALKKTLMQIGLDVQKHHTQENEIRKDPACAELVHHVDENYAHIRNIEQEASNELKNATEMDKELLLRVYKKD